MKDNIKFRRQLVKRGVTLAVSLPSEVVQWLEANEGEDVIVMPDSGKYGKFVSIWIPDNREEKKDVTNGQDE